MFTIPWFSNPVQMALFLWGFMKVLRELLKAIYS